MAGQRDYYADLELPRDADISEVRKQFRKLALKYHPDRNPGREQEVNAKFQIIQSAHEVLSDPAEKAKYDATPGRSRYSGASGVRGNPWANAGAQFQPPPRRTAAPRGAAGATSGAQRWQSRFASGVPPTAKQTYGSDPDAKKNAAKAFESMRNNARGEARANEPPPPPPRQTPRTESARQRAEASFGSRKAGYYPRSTMPGDEPPVSSSNYSSTKRRNVPPPPPQRPGSNPMPDPLSQFRDKGDKGNSSAPARDEPQHNPNPPRRPQNEDKGGRQPQSTEDGAGSRTQTSFEPGADATDAPETSNHAASTGQPDIPLDDKSTKSGNGPSMYATPHSYKLPRQPGFVALSPNASQSRPLWTTTTMDLARSRTSYTNKPPSGTGCGSVTSTSFERQQTNVLNTLIGNRLVTLQPMEEASMTSINSFPDRTQLVQLANQSRMRSFSFPVDEDTFKEATTAPGGSSFSKSSIDDINTSFVNDENPDSWQFSAGARESDADAKVGNSSSPGGPRRPIKRATTRRVDGTNAASNAAQSEGGFNAEGWSDKFGPQTFVPQPPPGPSASPTRTNRTNSKKTKLKPTVGTAAAVEEDFSSDSDIETYEWRGRMAQGRPTTTDSPQAMDIDSPWSSSSGAAPQAARNIPVEPSRPEWRAGKCEGAPDDERPQRPAKIPLDPNAAGSEDSEEFRASFADLKNVAPLGQQKEGLESFNGLKDNLPFESKASEVPPSEPSKTQPLAFPTPPIAPRLPPTVAIDGMKPNITSWNAYLIEFEQYFRQWDAFNSQVVDHFATRKAVVADARASKGYGFLRARGDGDIQEYYNWVQQDNDVRRRWNEACENHEKRLRELMAFREKMKDDHA